VNLDQANKHTRQLGKTKTRASPIKGALNLVELNPKFLNGA